ncbi:MAG: hypothetical protein DRI54_05290, partial [Bacteroidetes bacterium]
MYQTLKFPFGVNPYIVLSHYSGTAAWLNSNDRDKASILALGVNKEITLTSTAKAFDKLKQFYDQHKEWLFGYLSYDLKNSIESLKSENQDLHCFPVMHFFQPKVIIESSENFTNLLLSEDEDIKKWEKLIYKSRGKYEPSFIEKSNASIKSINKKKYLKNFDELLGHIQRGDIYEVNYCIEFGANEIEIDPLMLYQSLNRVTEAPFSVFYRSKGKYLLSGSPERY